MNSQKAIPKLVYADSRGRIYEDPELDMVCRKGDKFLLPGPKDLIPLPPESQIFLLLDRYAVGFNQSNGNIEYLEAHPVAAFVCPGYTLTGITAYISRRDACRLPLYAYAAVGYAREKFWISAQEVDADTRQKFEHIPSDKIERGIKQWVNRFPENRLLHHLSKCALEYSCPAAKNLALGRYEAPLPTAGYCNANCVGCISKQPDNSGFPASQDRISFRPTAGEITQIMFQHAKYENKPIYSFGQGCEGEPFLEAPTIRKAIGRFRSKGGKGTVNINTNASLPGEISSLAASGLSSIRVSVNSLRKGLYLAYFRPQSYELEDVLQSVAQAKKHGLFVSLNYLFFPGLNDSEEEFLAIANFIEDYKIDFIQLRNLNLDPELYLETVLPQESPAMGLHNFQKRLRQQFPWLEFGYFNPYLG